MDPVGRLIDGSTTDPDGNDRTWHLYVPSTNGTEPVPLLVALHGGLGSGEQFRENSGFDRLAESNKFLVVFPDGTRILPRRDNRVWNGGGCCGAAADGRHNVDDVGFISELIDQIKSEWPVDPARVFATGHSNGAIMSYRLACELSDQFSAVAFQAGSLEIADCQPTRPVSMMHIHGLDDTNIPIDGGRGNGVSVHKFASPRESVKTFASLDGCTSQAAITDQSNPDLAGTLWSDCSDGVVVEMLTVDGAGHAWMGHPVTSVQERMSSLPYPDLDSSRAVWGFLSGLS